ncbi:MAG: hypothetical protein IJ593_05435 [Lachnospiraceae bacterium]|nr:hypothetical protein [Lachnospiraceae bacterium]
MNPNVDINAVRQYNASLKEYQQKSAQMRAAIEFNKKELNRLCEELSTELGMTVTPENIEQVRDAKIEEINNSLEIGNQMLNRIKAEEEIARNSSTVGSVNHGSANNGGFGGTARPVQQVTSPFTQAPFNTVTQSAPAAPDAPVTPFTAPAAPVAPSVTDNDGVMNNIPPIFAL